MNVRDEVRLGLLQLKNRFVMAPIKTALNLPGGTTTPEAESFYERIGRGGTGLVILEPAAVSPDGVEHPRQLRIHGDRHVAELKRLVEAVHRGGASAVIHLNHAGRAANPKVIGVRPLAPSARVCPTTGAEAAALSNDEIERIIDDFAQAARRAVEAGADAVELQCGHGYLVAQFLSERTNLRNDRWEEGSAFADAVLDGVAAAISGVPLIVRISGEEFVEGGLDPENQTEFLGSLEEKGVSALHVGFGNSCDNPAWYFGHMALPERPQIDVLDAIRSRTALPVIAAGRMGFPDRIREILDHRSADLIGLARPLIADPDFPDKMLRGDEDSILLCGACLQACLGKVKSGQPIACMANPWVTEPVGETATTPKTVMVVGGGPAGLGAAVTAARRGHSVSLYERRKTLGGQFAFAVQPEGKTTMSRMLDGMVRRLERSGTVVHTGTAVSAELIHRTRPDVVILATGARQRRPEIKGLSSQHVITSFDFFEGSGELRGDRILVLGAGMVGLEVAEMLLARGKTVVACRRSPEIGADMDPISRKMMLGRIGDHPRLTLLPGTTLLEFSDRGVRGIRDGEEFMWAPFDTVILCSGMAPETSLLDELGEFPGKIMVIGDAETPSNIDHAFRQGVAAGNHLEE